MCRSRPSSRLLFKYGRHCKIPWFDFSGEMVFLEGTHQNFEVSSSWCKPGGPEPQILEHTAAEPDAVLLHVPSTSGVNLGAIHTRRWALLRHIFLMRSLHVFCPMVENMSWVFLVVFCFLLLMQWALLTLLTVNSDAGGDGDAALRVSAGCADTPRSALLTARGDGDGMAPSTCAQEQGALRGDRAPCRGRSAAATKGDGVARGTLRAGCAGRHGVEQPAPGGRRAPRSCAEALSRKARRRESDAPKALPSLSSLHFDSAFLPVERSFSLHPSLVTDDSCHTHETRLCNSCGVEHMARVNSWGTPVRDAYNSGGHDNSDACARTNSCGGAHAHGGGPEMKTPRQCSGDQGGRPAVNNAPRTASVEFYLRRAPKDVQVEAWESRVVTCVRPKAWVGTFAEGCEVFMSSLPDFWKGSRVPGPGPLPRDSLGWTKKIHTGSFGIWLLRGALQGEQVWNTLVSCVDWAVRSTYRTAWAVAPRCRCSYYGSGPVRPQSGGCSWELLRGLWRAVAPLMTPWCSEEDVPSSANLNLYGGSGSCVRWHSDDEALFGERGDPKLIVSLSLGSSALFKWKPRSCPEGEESSCWLHHGDLLVMDGCCQDEYLHCTCACGFRATTLSMSLTRSMTTCITSSTPACCVARSV